MSQNDLHAAITYNVKPEKDNLSPQGSPLTETLQNSSFDTYAEWDSPETIEAIRAALAQKYTVTMIEANQHVYEQLRAVRPDIVFNVAEGFHGSGREAHVPAMLEFLQIPYTGSDPVTLAICLDKARTKEVLSYYGIPSPKFILLQTNDITPALGLRFPLIVKPNAEGSSKGIFESSFVTDAAALQKETDRILDTYYTARSSNDYPVLVEEFLPGREFTVAMLGNGNDITILPLIELDFTSLPQQALPLFSYEAKWVYDTREKPLHVYNCPASVTEELRSRIHRIALETFKVLRIRDWCRIDIRLDAEGVPNIIEVNPLPGILPNPDDNSCFPKAAREFGLSYNELLQRVVEIALQRYGIR